MKTREGSPGMVNGESDIRADIVQKRNEKIRTLGHCLGHDVPLSRKYPVVPFVNDDGRLVICEIKRRSPSKGTIDGQLNPLIQAGLYREAGVRAVSVLTEEDYFSGSLVDLMEVKGTYPELAVLRKDFLVDVEDVEVSYRAGADAILLITSVLEIGLLGAMLHRAEELGMTALVEVHTYGEILAVRRFAPKLMGINSRNLRTFQMDALLPPVLKHGIDWPCSVVYESGIFTTFQARWAGDLDFGGILVGEAVVRNPTLTVQLVRNFSQSNYGGEKEPGGTGSGRQRDFWNHLTRRLFYLHHASEDGGLGLAGYKGPLVKVCGITRKEDALLATAQGADILGFIFAPSPRRVDLALLEEVRDVPVLKAVVVVWESPGPDNPESPAQLDQKEQLFRAWEDGLFDVLQLHGREDGEFCHSLPIPWYKAVKPRETGSYPLVANLRSPRVLVDAFDEKLAGGTGKRVQREVAQEFAQGGGLWLAGGINSTNIQSIIQEFQPELVDVSSGLESSPGIKSPEAIRQFFQEIQSARQ